MQLLGGRKSGVVTFFTDAWGFVNGFLKITIDSKARINGKRIKRLSHNTHNESMMGPILEENIVVLQGQGKEEHYNGKYIVV